MTIPPLNRHIASAEMDDSTGSFHTFHAYYTTSTPNYAEDSDGYPYGANKNYSVCQDTKWFYYFPIYRQSYTDYTAQFTYSPLGQLVGMEREQGDRLRHASGRDQHGIPLRQRGQLRRSCL